MQRSLFCREGRGKRGDGRDGEISRHLNERTGVSTFSPSSNSWKLSKFFFFFMLPIGLLWHVLFYGSKRQFCEKYSNELNKSLGRESKSHLFFSRQTKLKTALFSFQKVISLSSSICWYNNKKLGHYCWPQDQISVLVE